MDNLARATFDPTAPLAPQIYAYLRALITRNAVYPGQPLAEQRLALRLAVPQPALREAILRLAGEGLVDLCPDGSPKVGRICMSGVVGARFLREAIEADIVKAVAERADFALITELREQIVRQKLVCGRDPRSMVHLDERFHRTLAEAAGVGPIWRDLEGLKLRMDRVRHLSPEPLSPQPLIEQHSAIVDRIAMRDVFGAEAAMRGHLRDLVAVLPALVQRFPDYFDTPQDDPEGPPLVPLR